MSYGKILTGGADLARGVAKAGDVIGSSAKLASSAGDLTKGLDLVGSLAKVGDAAGSSAKLASSTGDLTKGLSKSLDSLGSLGKVGDAAGSSAKLASSTGDLTKSVGKLDSILAKTDDLADLGKNLGKNMDELGDAGKSAQKVLDNTDVNKLASKADLANIKKLPTDNFKSFVSAAKKLGAAVAVSSAIGIAIASQIRTDKINSTDYTIKSITKEKDKKYITVTYEPTDEFFPKDSIEIKHSNSYPSIDGIYNGLRETTNGLFKIEYKGQEEWKIDGSYGKLKCTTEFSNQVGNIVEDIAEPVTSVGINLASDLLAGVTGSNPADMLKQLKDSWEYIQWGLIICIILLIISSCSALAFKFM